MAFVVAVAVEKWNYARLETIAAPLDSEKIDFTPLAGWCSLAGNRRRMPFRLADMSSCRLFSGWLATNSKRK